MPKHNGEHHLSPKTVFLHLLMIVTLYISVISFIALLFQYINILLPDQLDWSLEGAYEGLRWSSAALLICLPVFLLMSWMIEKEVLQSSQGRQIGIRKWLLYLTLFISAITIIVDLIRLVYNFYGGELTTQFVLKVLVVLVVAVAVFGYYLWELRRKEERSNVPRMTAVVTGVVVLVALIAGFFVAGTPGEQRKVRFDERRVSDLQILQGEITNYWTRKEALPQSLDDLVDDLSGFLPPKDPETETPYGYRVIDELTFELCATFTTERTFETDNAVSVKYGRYYPIAPYSGSNWSHDMGLTCFERTIDPELYQNDVPVK